MEDVSDRKKLIGALYIEDVIDFFMKNYMIVWKPPYELSKNLQEVPVLFTPEIGRTAFIISHMFEYSQKVEESKLHKYFKHGNMFFYHVFKEASKYLEERIETGFFHMSAYAAEVAVFCQLKNMPKRHVDVIAAIMVLLDCKLNLDVEKSRVDYQQLAKRLDDERNKSVMANQSNSNENRSNFSYAEPIEHLTTSNRPALVPAYQKPNVNSSDSEMRKRSSPTVLQPFLSGSVSYPLHPNTPSLQIPAKPTECLTSGSMLLPQAYVNSSGSEVQRLESPNIAQRFSFESVSHPLPSSTSLFPIPSKRIECITPGPVLLQQTNANSNNSEVQGLVSPNITQRFSSESVSYPLPPSIPFRPIPVKPIGCITPRPLLLPPYQKTNVNSSSSEAQRFVSPNIVQRYSSGSISYPLPQSTPLLPVSETMFSRYPYQNLNVAQCIPASSPAPEQSFMRYQHVFSHFNEGFFSGSAVKSRKSLKGKSKFHVKSFSQLKKSSLSKFPEVATFNSYSSNDNSPVLLYSSEKHRNDDSLIKASKSTEKRVILASNSNENHSEPSN